MSRRFAGFAVAAVLQLVALVLAHELVFLARYGSRFGEMLVHTGHGETWSAAVDDEPRARRRARGGGSAPADPARPARSAPRGPGQCESTGALEPRALLRAWLRIAPRDLPRRRRAAHRPGEPRARVDRRRRCPASGSCSHPSTPAACGSRSPSGWRSASSRRCSSGAGARSCSHGCAPRGRGPSGDQPPRCAGPGLSSELPVSSLLGRRSALRAPPLPAAP